LRPARLAGIAAIILLPLPTACGDSTGLGDGVDPLAAAAALDSVAATFFSNNIAVSSLAALGPFISAATTQTGVGSFDPAEQANASVPEELLGRTFAWDPADRRYVPDPNDDGGAPQNGVRFRIYTPDASTGLPTVPLENIGFVDVVDWSTIDRIDVSLNAAVGGATLVDYSVRGPQSFSAFDLTSSGHLSDGVNRLDFVFDVEAVGRAFTFRFAFEFGQHRITFRLDRGDTGAGGSTVRITDGVTDAVIEFALNFDRDGVIGEASGASVDGRNVAVLSGTTEQAFLERSGGVSLTSEELQALGNLFDNSGLILAGLGDLFEVGAQIGSLRHVL
jgi:hypothetical protein